MKQFLKNTTAAVLISVTLGTGSVCAGQVEAPTETISVLGMFVQKISKVGFYIDTITEGVTYVSSVGKKGFNAAVGALSSMAGNLSGFQDMLHFADASSFNALLDKAESTIDTVKEDVGVVNDAIDSAKENINTATGLVEKAKNEISNASVDSIVNEIKGDKAEKDAAIEEARQRISAVVSDGTPTDNSENNSAYARVGTMQGSYGAPQQNKQSADAYVKKMFFYSTKDGDKYEGKPLNETSKAEEAVQKNRNNYRSEVISTAYATALESRTTGFEASLKRYEAIKQKAASAASEDDKRAVGALITQEETRQRIARLALELTVLEQDVVNDLLEQPTNILIARTVEQIQAETQKENNASNFNPPTSDDGQTQNGGQS